MSAPANQVSAQDLGDCPFCDGTLAASFGDDAGMLHTLLIRLSPHD